MFEYFYHEILRRTIISFGTLFNNISIQHKNDSGSVVSIIKVPLAYGPTQKFLARVEQEPDLNKPIQITLPRMSFEFVGLNYDNSRKVTTTQTFFSKNSSSELKRSYMPVPYNMEFELSIMTKQNDDMLQIVEQILPYFQPNFTLTVDLVDQIGEKRDIPIILNNINMDDDYEGDFSTRRALIYTLSFTAKTYLFGPTSDTTLSKDIIKKVSIGYASGESSSVARREITYSSEAVATKSYTNNVVANLNKDVELLDTIISVNDSSQLTANSYITLNDETLKVRSIDGNKVTVIRGSYGTSISQHVLGTEIKLITGADNDLIKPGDDFGFSGAFS
jgi:hypothetical protein